MTKTTVGTVHDGKDDIYIGRPHKSDEWQWGNPFPLNVYSREESIRKFVTFFHNSLSHKAKWMRANVHRLHGQHLKCFCKPLPCHGDFLAAMADKREYTYGE